MRPTPPSTTVGAPPRCGWIGRSKGMIEMPAAQREADTAAAAVVRVDEEHNDGQMGSSAPASRSAIPCTPPQHAEHPYDDPRRVRHALRRTRTRVLWYDAVRRRHHAHARLPPFPEMMGLWWPWYHRGGGRDSRCVAHRGRVHVS